MSTFRARRGRVKSRKDSLVADQHGAVAFETIIVSLFLIASLLLPLTDVAIAGFKYISAYQALRDMGQRTQYSPPGDVTSSTSITAWQSSLPAQIEGYTVSAQVYCGDPGATCTSNTTLPKYYVFTTSFTLSPMVLGKVLCSTCTVTYSERFQ